MAKKTDFSKSRIVQDREHRIKELEAFNYEMKVKSRFKIT